MVHDSAMLVYYNVRPPNYLFQAVGEKTFLPVAFLGRVILISPFY